MIFDLFPQAYQPPAQISNQGRACTEVLLLYQKNLGVFPPKREKEKEI
jgi:hypothetical protein